MSTAVRSHMKELRYGLGIASQAFLNSSVRNCWIVQCSFLTDRSNSSHTSSVGERSGGWGGQTICLASPHFSFFLFQSPWWSFEVLLMSLSCKTYPYHTTCTPMLYLGDLMPGYLEQTRFNLVFIGLENTVPINIGINYFVFADTQTGSNIFSQLVFCFDLDM